MITLTHVVAGDTTTIRVPEYDEDFAVFETWMLDNVRAPLGLDTETTGLNVFGAGFGIRLLQIGTGMEAWVIRAQQWAQQLAHIIRRHPKFIAHNWAYDAPVVERALGVTIEEMTSKVYDTMIISKLVEPHRPAGHKLKSLSAQYVDPDAADTQDGLVGEFRKIGHTKDTGWAYIAIDNELYNRYAGLDVIYVSRLFPILVKKAKALLLEALSSFEHTTQGYLNIIRRRGLLIDLDYAATQQAVFLEEARGHLDIARDKFGLANLNSPQQVADALLRSGAMLTERTGSGQYKTGKEVLLPLAGMDEYWGDIEGFENPNELASHIARGKRAERFGNSYLGKFIDLADPDGRIHPGITGLQARTSRMAVSDPPLQQLPSKDSKVRRAILADPGQLIISADYAQIEMRLVAAMADIKNMKKAIHEGLDLHGYTAELAYGPGFTKANRTHMKGAGFGIVYGGGAKGLAPKLGIDYAAAKRVVDDYNKVYPEIKRWSGKLQRDARANRMIMRSPTGRILALDRDRVYAAINYQVQSTAADVLKNALEALFLAGLGDHILMPVHDEIIAQAPAAQADEVARAIGEAMTTEVMGMPLDAEGEVYGDNWGMGYGGLSAASDSDKPPFKTAAFS